MIDIWDNKQQKRCSSNDELNNKVNDLCGRLAESICKKEAEESLEQPKKKRVLNDYVFLYSNHYKVHKTSWD